MKKINQVVIGSIFIFVSAGVLADDHEMFAGDLDPAEPMSIQANICTLNDGVSVEDYAAFFKRYQKWALKNDAEVASVRQFPLATHSNSNNPYQADFVEFLITGFENAGTSWDKWMMGKSGQKLNAEWQELASCHVKFAAMFTQWADVGAINSDNDRVVTWNWCSRKEGVSHDMLNAAHVAFVEENPEGLGNIGWFTLYPNIGGGDSAGEFAHVVVYPNMEGLMEHQEWFARGGWRGRMNVLVKP
jgi:hypothetical protein